MLIGTHVVSGPLRLIISITAGQMRDARFGRYEQLSEEFSVGCGGGEGGWTGTTAKKVARLSGKKLKQRCKFV